MNEDKTTLKMNEDLRQVSITVLLGLASGRFGKFPGKLFINYYCLICFTVGTEGFLCSVWGTSGVILGFLSYLIGLFGVNLGYLSRLFWDLFCLFSGLI